MKRRNSIALALAAGLLLTAATSAFGGIARIDADAELRLGREIDKWVHKTRKFARNWGYQERIDRIGHAVAGAADPEGRYTWRFQISNEPHRNMAASCAGYVYITRGMMAAGFGDDELAGAMAHEMVHIMKQHVAKSYMVEYAALEFNDKVVDRAVQDLNMMRHGAAGPFQVFNYGRRKMERDFEREADSLGVHYAAEAGFDPMGHARLLKILLGNREAPTDLRKILLLSHPPSSERIKRIETEARRVSGKSDEG
ncbi:MAG: hypothetical protein FJX76_10520 [Armatimonadetes bacterium]|nr:hypothetical protein [Armatimonadota bacterium]